MAQPRKARAAAAPKRRSRLLDWKAILGITISVLVLWLAFRSIDLRQVDDYIRTADPLLFLFATSLSTFVFWIRAWRWKSILQPERAGIPFRSRFAAVTIGFMGNNLLPARMGEFMRAYALARMEPVTVVASFASLVMERFFDGIVMIAFLFMAMALPSFPEVRVSGGLDYPAIAASVGVFIALAVVVLSTLVIFPRRAIAFMERLAQFLPKAVRRPLIDAMEAFLRGVGILRDPILLMRAGGWSLVLWLVNASGFYFAFRAFGMDLPFTAALFFQSCIAIAVSAPSAPGYVGVYHGAAIAVLAGMWGVEQARAAAFAISYHLAGFIPVTLMGLYYAWRIGMRFGEVKKTEDVVEHAVEAATGADRIIDGGERP